MRAVHDEAGTNSTLNVFDTINLGGGTNTLELSIIDTGGAGTAALDAASAPEFTNVQVLTLKNLAATASGADLTGIAPDLTTLNFNASTADYTVDGVGADVTTIGLSNVKSDNADVDVTYAAGLTGTADTLTLNLSAMSSATTATANTYAVVDINHATAGSGFEVVHINSNGTSANRLDSLVSEDNTTSVLEKVVIEGTAALRINVALANTVETIDATNASGGVNLGVTAGGNVTFTGGAGNDRINMAAGLDTNDDLDGGTGTNTLAIDLAALTSTKTTAINKAIEAQTNFQKLEITTAANSSDTAVGVSVAANGLTTIKSFVFSGGGTGGAGTAASGSTAAGAGWDAIQVTGLASNNTHAVEVAAATTGGVGGAGSGSTEPNGADGGDAIELLPALNAVDSTTITVKGNITGGNGGAGDASNNGDGGDAGHGINAAQFETLNLVSSGATATSTNTIVGGTGGSEGSGSGSAGDDGFGIVLNTNSTLNITGANDLTLTASTVDPNAGGMTINAAEFTGDLDVTASAGNDTIYGGKAENTIKAGAGRDAIDISVSSAKQDTIDLTDVTAAANRDTITGFVAGSASTADVVSITDDGTLGLKAITGTSTAFTLAGTDDVTEFAFDAVNNDADLSAATDGTELFKAIAAQGSTISTLNTGAAQASYLLAYQGGKAYLYYFNNADTDAGGPDTNALLAAGEVSLIGVFNDIEVGAFTVDNFA